MIVTSFFPGRIRLRAPVFKDRELFEKARSIIENGTDAVNSIENNPLNGSVLITYSPEKLPLDKLAGLQDFFLKLGKKAEHYTPDDKEEVMKMLEDFEEISKKWK